MSKQGPNLPPGISVKDFVLRPFDGEPVASPSDHEFVFSRFDDTADRIELTLAQAEEVSRHMREEAAAEAERTRAEAQALYERLKKEGEALKVQAQKDGHAAGHAAGMTQGLAEGKKSFEDKAAPLIAGLDRFDELFDRLWAAQEPLLVQMVLNVVRKIVLHEASTSPETVSAALKAAFDLLQGQHQVVFRAHPDNIELLMSARDEIRDRIHGLLKVQFEPDPDLGPGDLIMETDSGRLDATVKRRLESVLRPMEDVLNQRFDIEW